MGRCSWRTHQAAAEIESVTFSWHEALIHPVSSSADESVCWNPHICVFCSNCLPHNIKLEMNAVWIMNKRKKYIYSIRQERVCVVCPCCRTAAQHYNTAAIIPAQFVFFHLHLVSSSGGAELWGRDVSEGNKESCAEWRSTPSICSLIDFKKIRKWEMISCRVMHFTVDCDRSCEMLFCKWRAFDNIRRTADESHWENGRSVKTHTNRSCHVY